MIEPLRPILLGSIVATIASLGAPVPAAWACACCAHPGDWFQTITSLTDGNSALTSEKLRLLPFSGHLRDAASRPVNARFQDDKFIVRLAAAEAPIVFEFVRPDQFVETRSATSADINGPLLSKQMVFTGPLQSFCQPEAEPETGEPWATSSGAIAAEGRLILQAYGNHCLNPGDFERWILQWRLPGQAQFSTVAFGTIDDGSTGWQWRIEEQGEMDNR